MADNVFTGAYDRMPWHKKGYIAGRAMTAKEALEFSQLEYNVIADDLFCGDGTVINGYKVTRRGDNKSILGVVSDRYKIIQNIDAFQTIDRIVGTGLASINSAFCLGKGEKICISCEVPSVKSDDGDPLKGFIVVTNSHDGKSACSWIATLVRVVCENTLNMAFKNFEVEDDDKVGYHKIKIRHSGDITAKLFNAEEFMKSVIEGLDYDKKCLNNLKSSTITDDEFKRMVLELIPPPSNAKKIADVPTRTQNAWSSVMWHWHRGRGMNNPISKNTAYGAVNAIAEYADWAKGTRKTDGKDEFSAKTESILWGSSFQLKQKGAELVQEYVMHKKQNTEVPKKSLVEDILGIN